MSSLLEIYDCSRNAYYNSEELYVLTKEDIKILNNAGLELPENENVEVTDDLFDTIQNLIISLKGTAPKAIGAPVPSKDIRKTTLPIPLPSIIECKENELYPFIKNNDSKEFVITEKLDGCSCLIHFVNRTFHKAYTRGDGLTGQDITSLIFQMSHHIPFRIPSDYSPHREYFVRGELIIPKNEIDTTLTEMQLEDGKPRKNARNAVAGQLNRLIFNMAFLKHVRFVAYQGLPAGNVITMPFGETQMDTLNTLKKVGFDVSEGELVWGNPEQLKAFFDDEAMRVKVDLVKTNSKYECDGVVVYPNSISYRTFLPVTKDKMYSVGVRKYKLNNLDYNKATTRIVDIEWRISKGGLLKPRIRVEPIVLGGVVISYVTGNNYKYVKDNELGIGATVVLRRAGDVIPQIIDVIKKSDNLNLPKDANIGDVDAYIADNEELKKEQNFKQFQFACSFFNIEQAGEGNLRKLFEQGCTDLDKLIVEKESTYSKLLGLNGIKMFISVSDIFYDKGISYAQYCAANNLFGSRIGVRLLDRVYNKYATLDVTPEMLQEVEGFSTITIDKYMFYKDTALARIKDIRNKASISWNNIRYDDKVTEFKHLVLFTGVRDKALERKIVEQGGKIVTTVNQANLLVAKDLNSSSLKMEKAKEKNITIISYEDAKVKFGE